MAEALFAGLVGFLIGRGIEPKDATAVVEALRTYLGFEPPLGLTGYALDNVDAGKEANAAVVVRGKSYDVVALESITKHSCVSVLGKKDERLEVAPIIDSLSLIREVRLIQDKSVLDATDIDIWASASCPSGVFTDVLSYTVPSGKTLLIYDWSGGLSWVDGQAFGRLGWMPPFITVVSVSGGSRGFSVPLSKPKRVVAGKTVKVALTHALGSAQDMDAHLGGILV